MTESGKEGFMSISLNGRARVYAAAKWAVAILAVVLIAVHSAGTKMSSTSFDDMKEAVMAAADQVRDETVDPLGIARPAAQTDFLRNFFFRQKTGPDRVVQIVIDIGDPIAEPDAGGFPRVIRRTVRMVQDSHPGLIAEIQTLSAALKEIHYPQTLLIVAEAAGMNPVQSAFSGVAKGSMAEIVPERDGLGEILVQLQRPAHGTGQTADFQGMGQTGAIVVSLRLEENLGFVLQTPEGLAVGDPVHIALKAGPDLALRFFPLSAAGFRCPHAVRTYEQKFQLFTFFSGIHDCPPACRV